MTGFPDTYLLESILAAPGRHYLSWKRHAQHVLQLEEAVEWAVQQKVIRREKRDIFYYDYKENMDSKPEPDDPLETELLINVDTNKINYQLAKLKGREGTRKHHRTPLFNDELWDHEWYLVSGNSFN